jgi:sulfopyruvate decarboxylase subunit alpha
MFFTGDEIRDALSQLGFTHIIWLPDSELGTWEAALDDAAAFRLLRVCREGEAWPLAAGLWLGDQRPLVIMQTTGLFESGDALRNVLHDLCVPVWAVFGGRSLLVEHSADSARRFAEPVLQTWGLDYARIAAESEKPKLIEQLREALANQRSAAVLIAEGRM